MVRPLTEDAVRIWALEGRPTYAQWDAALRAEDLSFPGRGTGRCTILYRDGEPTEIAYCGVYGGLKGCSPWQGCLDSTPCGGEPAPS